MNQHFQTPLDHYQSFPLTIPYAQIPQTIPQNEGYIIYRMQMKKKKKIIIPHLCQRPCPRSYHRRWAVSCQRKDVAQTSHGDACTFHRLDEQPQPCLQAWSRYGWLQPLFLPLWGETQHNTQVEHPQNTATHKTLWCWHHHQPAIAVLKTRQLSMLGNSGGVVKSLYICQASLKSLGCFYFWCILFSQWKAVTVNWWILHCQL